MIHTPIQIKNLELSFPHKTCFENFSTEIIYGSRIAIIGRNGSGKSTLLDKIWQEHLKSTDGNIIIPENAVFGYVPQIIEDYKNLSGGQRLNKAITNALSLKPNILLLDEPTNHLDQRNRKSLMRLLQLYSGTLIVVSHDTELLQNCINTLWHIDHGKIHIFSGNYNDYIKEIKLKRSSIENDLIWLSRQKKNMHAKLMQEQQRAAKSKVKGEKNITNRKYTKMASGLKAMKAEKSQGKKFKSLDNTKQKLTNQLLDLRLPEIITPKFSIDACDTGSRVLIQISDGYIGYGQDNWILSKINLTVFNRNRIAISGDNASGKSTLIKAILGDKTIYKKGEWFIPKIENTGYLDQHYSNLVPDKSVFETISDLTVHWTHAEIRSHLNDFLFRKNEEVNAMVKSISGGEKARLSLAKIAAYTPKLLILDEITNNLDLETKEHVCQVLRAYPGAMIVISHDMGFLKDIKINDFYQITDGFLRPQSL